MSRRPLLPLTWLACTVAAIGLAWFAVSSVMTGTEARLTATGPSGSALGPTSTTTTTSMPTTVPDGPAAADPDAAAPAASDPSGAGAADPGDAASGDPDALPADPPPAAVVSRSFAAEGGVVTVQCQGEAISLVSAAPYSGHSVRVDDSGPDRVKVSFRGGTESEVEAQCAGGVPVRHDSGDGEPTSSD